MSNTKRSRDDTDSGRDRKRGRVDNNQDAKTPPAPQPSPPLFPTTNHIDVETSHDMGQTWTPDAVPANGPILVIEDGVGRRRNAGMFRRLARSHQLVFVRAGKERSFNYPAQWNTNPHFPYTKHDLGGFGHEVGQHILRSGEVPSLILCGSRGGQVVANVITREAWRGPIININGGMLSSRTPLYPSMYMCFITSTRDFFSTKNPDHVSRVFSETATNRRCQGLNIVLRGEKHVARGRVLGPAIEGAIAMATTRPEDRDPSAVDWPEVATVYALDWEGARVL